ncbi:MAG: alpha/beta hydrolase [Ferruginibacter sp.]
MKNFISLIALYSLFLASCTKEETSQPPQVIVSEKTMLNVSYGTAVSQNMDVYLPANRTTATTKVVIMIHGGGWSTGDKADFTSYVDTLKNRLPSYAIININYRLASTGVNLFPTQENDVKSAIDFIYSKRGEYGISDKFVLLGASAGAHLAMLHAYKYTTPVKIKAVIDFFGPADMTAMYNNPASIYAPPAAIAAVVGGTPASNPLIYQQSSPINYVTAQTPPTLILQGGVDILVAPSQSSALQFKLESMGVIHEYVFYPTENHGWTGANLVHSFQKIQFFLAANVQ